MTCMFVFKRGRVLDRFRKWRASVALAVGLAVGAAPAAGADKNPPPAAKPDPRLTILRNYFKSNRSPLDRHAEVFLSAADSNGLDWRLLPALAMVESSGGKHYIRNNVFGWDSGRARFRSIQDGIVQIAAKLVTLPAYKGKDLQGLLRTYNPARRDYPQRVIALIRQIAPDPPVPASAAAR